MSVDSVSLKGSHKLGDLWHTLSYRVNFRKNNPTYFDADGLIVFVGSQGSGKTLSAVQYTIKLLKAYPKSKLCTNLMLKDYPIVTFNDWLKVHYPKIVYQSLNAGKLSEQIKKELFEEYKALNRVFPFNDNDDLTRYENLDEGIIFLIDEIQLYMNSLESKNINMAVMTEISQQRKQRKHIVATSQVFGRLAKPLREQFSNVVQCKCILNLIQFNQLIDKDSIEDSADDMKLKGKVLHNYIWFHSPNLYDQYDTYYKVQKHKFKGDSNPEIYK